jgi:Na+/H+ antiporter NhaD/arsenite permease-like protein
MALSPLQALASSVELPHISNLTDTTYGLIAIIVFICAYALVVGEEYLHLRKSKPVIVAAGIIWILVSIAYSQSGDHETAGVLIRHNIEEFAELMLFLLAAMTYVNTMEERNVFAALRSWLVTHGFSYMGVYWITGLLAFLISPLADNLTTALLLGAVVIAISDGNRKFTVVACINIVIAANAGGAFSPFGDITTLMVWQKGIIDFTGFFTLVLPSLVNWLVPAALMCIAIPNESPPQVSEYVSIKPCGMLTVLLFLVTIAMAIGFHSLLHLPPMVGMMTGLGLLKFLGYYLKRKQAHDLNFTDNSELPSQLQIDTEKPFDIFHQLQRSEWDTLFFFYGVVMSVGGLGALGYLAEISANIYTPEFGVTTANVLVGVFSAVVDNIPVMFAVLSMNPEMSEGQWLLVTLTAGVGGSLLSIGSAAGVALMGQARGTYTFFAHLKWSWAIALGYAASIWVHLLFNADLM